jgi:hypothetical protein
VATVQSDRSHVSSVPPTVRFNSTSNTNRVALRADAVQHEQFGNMRGRAIIIQIQRVTQVPGEIRKSRAFV